MAHAPAQCLGSPPPRALGRGQKFNFLNMVMWHVKLKGMSSRPRYNEQFLTYDKTGDLGMGSKGSITIRFLRELGDLRWRAVECVLLSKFDKTKTVDSQHTNVAPGVTS